MRRLHILRDLLEYAKLRARGFEGQHLLDFVAHPIVQLERNARLQSRLGTLERQPALQPEKLFEDQPPVRWSAISIQHAQVGVGGGEVERADSSPKVEKFQPLTHRRRKMIFQRF